MTAAALTADQVRDLANEMSAGVVDYVFAEPERLRKEFMRLWCLGFDPKPTDLTPSQDVSRISNDVALITDRVPLDDECTQWQRVNWLVREHAKRVLILDKGTIVDPMTGDTLCTFTSGDAFRAVTPDGKVLIRDTGRYSCMARTVRVFCHVTA